MKQHGENLNEYLLSERNQSEKATYYMLPALRHSEKGKTVEILKRSVAAKGWEQRWISRAQRSLGNENTPYDIILMHICHYIVSKCLNVQHQE